MFWTSIQDLTVMFKIDVILFFQNFRYEIMLFLTGLGRFSESIIYYVANAENAPYPDITTDRFFGEIYSSYDVLFNVWLNSKEPKVREGLVTSAPSSLPLSQYPFNSLRPISPN